MSRKQGKESAQAEATSAEHVDESFLRYKAEAEALGLSGKELRDYVVEQRQAERDAKEKSVQAERDAKERQAEREERQRRAERDYEHEENQAKLLREERQAERTHELESMRFPGLHFPVHTPQFNSNPDQNPLIYFIVYSSSSTRVVKE
ncbi:hypothetical protein ACOMHN_064367 [Nucella lapillus]